jgi:hypothetical protein
VNATRYNGSTFTEDQATSGGGAICYAPAQNTSSQLSLSNTTFRQARGMYGGALAVFVKTDQGAVTSTADRCLFRDNASQGPPANLQFQSGGAIAVFQRTQWTGSASFTVTNSTFYDNEANFGGALMFDTARTQFSTNQVTLTSLTLTQNHAATGGGAVWVSQTEAALLPRVRNCIIAANTVDAGGTGRDVRGAVASDGFNLIGVTDGSSGWLAGDLKGTAAAPLVPGLDQAGPTFNGGYTDTIRLILGSPAYRSGDPGLSGTTDQRGYLRVLNALFGWAVSIGAYDPDAMLPAPPPPPPPPGG